MIQELNYRCKHNTLSFIISPTIKEWREIKRLRKNNSKIYGSNEIDGFNKRIVKLEKINNQISTTKIRMDLTEYKSIIEDHQ